MNTPRAVEFRYLWLELLCLEDPLSGFVEAIDRLQPESIRELRDAARARYLQQLVDERIAERRRYDRSLSKEHLRIPVTLEVSARLEDALGKWFEIPVADIRQWVSHTDFDVSEEDDSSPEEAEESVSEV